MICTVLCTSITFHHFNNVIPLKCPQWNTEYCVENTISKKSPMSCFIFVPDMTDMNNSNTTLVNDDFKFETLVKQVTFCR